MDPITGFFALLISILAICSMFAIIGVKKRLDEQTAVMKNIHSTTRSLIPAPAEEQQLLTIYKISTKTPLRLKLNDFVKIIDTTSNNIILWIKMGFMTFSF